MKCGSEAVGFIAMTSCSKDLCYLKRAGVLSTYAGQGLYRRMVRHACRHYAQLGHKVCVSDCTTWNVGSARGLLAAGFKPYWPVGPWALPDSIYWTKDLT